MILDQILQHKVKEVADAKSRVPLELLQDLVLAAVNEAGRKVDAEIEANTKGMAGGMGIPGLGL